MDVKVLIVDDSKMIHQKVRQTLASDQEYHFTFNICEDGEQALRYLCACEPNELPDIIILDRNMPNMTGDECIRILKLDENWRLIPVLFLTAQNDKQEIVKGLAVLEADDYLSKPFDDGEMLARVKVLVRIKRAEDQTRALNKNLEKANQFIRNTFSRYLSDEVVDTILESPDGLSLGGEKRTVSIMMTDLRGFTAIAEHFPAESVVKIINLYFEIMTEIVFNYQGTINDFIGDAILAVFGAPTQREDDAQRAVACALEMQLAMKEVNQRNQEAGYPEIAMGIGINTGKVIVGNIGSHKRTQYSVIGHHVNLASRIESYAVGGQILISESTQQACGSILCIDNQVEVKPKGIKEPIIINEVTGIGGNFNIFLEKKPLKLIELEKPLTIKFNLLVEKHISETLHRGKIVKLVAAKMAEVQTKIVVEKLTNLKIAIFNTKGHKVTADLYAKVTEVLSESPATFRIVFTSVSSEARNYLEKFCQKFQK